MTIDESKPRVGTRGSRLALWQAEHVAARLREQGREPEIVIIQTTGDLDQRSEFGSMGAKGIFVKEIETALLEGRIDLAVHSLKDLPTELPEGLVLPSFLPREVPFDALVSQDGRRLADLPAGATLATGSLRRAAQALALRPDLKIVPFRGNVPTRLKRIVEEGVADATLMAAAGLRRLELDGAITELFDAEAITPPMGQGIVALEARAGEFEAMFAALDAHDSRTAAMAERVFIHEIGGGCRTPAGALAETAGEGRWRLTGLIAAPDGRDLIRRSVESDAAGLNEAARGLARGMVGDACEAIRAAIRSA